MAAASLSAYLLGGAGGILAGGFLTQRGENDRLIAYSFGAAALLMLLLASAALPAWSILPLMACIGFCTGIAGPSRDLLVRKAAISHFGQAAYGGFMDKGSFASVLVGIAILQSLAILTALGVGSRLPTAA